MITEKIVTKVVPKKIYVTSDGKEFESKFYANRHEYEIMPERNFQQATFSLDDETTAVCYKIENIDDYRYLSAKKWDISTTNSYVGPGWYMSVRQDGGDYNDWYEVTYLPNYFNNLKEQLQAVEKILES